MQVHAGNNHTCQKERLSSQAYLSMFIIQLSYIVAFSSFWLDDLYQVIIAV